MAEDWGVEADRDDGKAVWFELDSAGSGSVPAFDAFDFDSFDADDFGDAVEHGRSDRGDLSGGGPGSGPIALVLVGRR